MDQIWGTVIAAAITGAVTFGGAWLVFRGKKVDLEAALAQVRASEGKNTNDFATGFLSQQREYQEYTDKLVNERVEAAVAPFRAELKTLSDRVAQMHDEQRAFESAVKSRETQLWLWNLHGRRGPMPELPRPVLRALEIEHLTTSPAGIDEDTIEIPRGHDPPSV